MPLHNSLPVVDMKNACFYIVFQFAELHAL